MIGSERTIDGAIGEGWSGRDPDGCHVNVVLAQRGSVTAAALMTAFTPLARGTARSSSASAPTRITTSRSGRRR